MRSSVSLALVIGFTLALTLPGTDAKRFGGSGGKRRPSGGGYKPKPAPAPAPRPKPAEQHDFLNAERGHSAGHTNQNPSAPQQPGPQANRPLGFEQFGAGTSHGAPQQPGPQANRPLGFEQFGAGTSHGAPQIGFDKVNSQVQNKPGSPFTPSAPNYPGGGSGSHVGPPPSYYPQGPGQAPHYGGVEHPPAYPGRPVNAPPAYTPNQANPHYGQTFGNPPPQQGQYGFPFQGQGYHGQQNFGQQNSFGNSYPQQPSFGSYGQGYHPSYPTQSYGGSPFGSSGYNGNPYYSPNNFGYSSNPGYFGQGYNNHYDDHKRSRFGGLPIPIPIPIPIGGGFGGFGGGYGSGFGGGSGGSSYHHRLLDTFIKNKEEKSDSGNSTSVFLLNNSTVTPCTTDHFQYGKLNITVMSCTAEFCTGVKVTTTTKMKDVESRHSAWLTMCLEHNETWTAGGDKVQPSVSGLHRENITVCRNLTVNSTQASTAEQNATTTTAVPDTTIAVADTTSAAPGTTTAAPNTTTAINTTVCDEVRCSWVEMCMTAIEIVDDCSGSQCPFRRSGYRPCVTVKMCRAANNPLSTFATLNTTLYTADEYDRRQSQHHVTNLTLISYHPPVVIFNPNCSSASPSTPGCPPPTATATPQSSQCPAGSTPILDPAGGNSTTCTPAPSVAPASALTDVTPGGSSAPESSTPLPAL